MKSILPKLYRVVRSIIGLASLVGLFAIGGCATGGIGLPSGNTAALPEVGPQLSSDFADTEVQSNDIGLPKIDVAVPMFDPNLPANSDTWEKRGIFPELRRAEATRFALKMKSALEDTGAFDRVRMVPSQNVTSDLYVIGKIIQSNGEDVKIDISATDISGKQWFTQTFHHRVKERFHNDPRNKGQDAYMPVFEEAAAYVVKQLKRRQAEDLERLRLISEIRFGSSLSEDTFARYLQARNGQVDLVAVPADDDPMRRRIQPIRVRDQLFLDRMQNHYTKFDQKLDPSYLVWQQQNLLEVKAARKARMHSAVSGVLSGLLLATGVAVAANSDSTASDIAAVASIGAGAVFLAKSVQTRREMKVHRDTIAELGQSIDLELAPQVVEYEDETTKLTGAAAEQYAQWAEFLKKIYTLEATPEKQL